MSPLFWVSLGTMIGFLSSVGVSACVHRQGRNSLPDLGAEGVVELFFAVISAIVAAAEAARIFVL